MIRWFLALSIRWKLQLGFFVVTMVTTIYNRTLATSELNKLIAIAEEGGVAAGVLEQLRHSRDSFVVNSFWESGLEFAVQFLVIGVVASMFVRPIRALCDALKAMENGDLTREVPIVSHDEIGVLERSFNSMQKMLNDLLGNISERGSEMGQSAYQISTISHEIAQVSKSEQQRSDEVSAATAELNQITDSVQQLAQDASGFAQRTEQHAGEGIAQVKETLRLMTATAKEVDRTSSEVSDLERAAGEIHAIVATISSIAEQTNLLSLNAAIEAARAGEQGRGFAVVADEVRSLSQRTAESLNEITTIIDALGARVQRVTGTMEKVVEHVRETRTNTDETAAVIERMAGEAASSARASGEITEASQQQGARLQALERTLNRLFETLEESASKVETTAAIGDDLFRVTEKLNQLLTGFRFHHHLQPERVSHEKRRTPRARNSLLVKLDNDGTVIEGISTDFSLTGIQLRLSEPLAKPECTELRLFMPKPDIGQYERQTPVAVRARVAWNRRAQHRGREQYVYGMEFVGLSDSAREQLRTGFEFFRKQAEFQDANEADIAHTA